MSPKPITSAAPRKAALEEVDNADRPAFFLTWTEVKLLGIAGVGFFLDAYDLFIINPVSTMLQYRLYGGNALPTNLEGLLKASANIGSVIGQFSFGFMADYFGRKAVYGKELMLIIIATILCLTTPTGTLSPDHCLIYLTMFRILLGVGVGGDYPMSASVTSDRANLRKRGTMLSYIFSNQGWGNLAGGIMTLIVLACYKHVMNDKGETSKVDGVWRIIVGFSLVPAFATLYQRLVLPEATRYIKSTNVHELESGDDLKKTKSDNSSGDDVEVVEAEKNGALAEADLEASQKTGASFGEFLSYMSEWRHFKILLGTCACWFLVDIAFYGINLNQNVVLAQIGFAGKTGTPWTKIFKVTTGGIIITVLGFVPGYWVTILTVETLGRKWIQIQGFLMEALFLAILAGKFHTLSKAGFIVCFTFLQFFFNFGANGTTFIYPAEVFPTRYRAFAHGISAGCGKAGAILSTLVFNTLSKHVGTDKVLWIFFAVSVLGAFFSLLLPEVKGRDPDAIFEEELRERAARA